MKLSATEADVNSKSRWADTTMQGYQQIVAISQGCINRSLKFLWDAELDPGIDYEYETARDSEAKNESPVLKEFTVEVDGEGTMEATMSAPTIKLLPNRDSRDGPPVVLFSLHVESGTYEWWTGRGKHSKRHVCQMKDWRLTFKVDLSLTAIEATEVPSRVRSQILVPGRYSISQLLIDFGSSDLAMLVMSESTIPGIEIGDDGKPVSTTTLSQKRLALTNFMQRYTEDLARSGKTILGYAVTADDLDPARSTFPPTLVKFQAMHFRDLSSPDDMPKASDSDIFLFLEMTDPQPKFPAESLRWTGNWVTPGSGGTLSICSNNIWQGYLLPILQPFNASALTLMSRLHLFFRENGRSQASELYDWSFDQYDEPHPRPADSTLTWVAGNKPELDGASFTMAKFSWAVYVGNLNLSHFCRLSTDVSFEPSKGAMKFRVNIQVEKRSQLGEPGCGAVYPENKINADIHLVYNIFLSSVSTGTLNVAVNRSEPEVHLTAHTDNNYGWGLEWKTSENDIRDQVKSNLVASPIMKKDELAQKIAKALNGYKHFVFPGGGTFDMKNPIFNKEGDLLVELTYKATKLVKKAPEDKP